MPDNQQIVAADTMSRDIAATSPLGSVAAMLEMMRELALNPDIDANKFETIARVANEQQDRAQRQQYYEAKARALRAMPSIRKDGRIVIAGKSGEPDRVQGHFAKWPDLQRAVTPHLDANQLRLTHDVDNEDGRIIVIPVLQHDNGFVERGGRMALPLDTSGGKNNTQGAGSAMTYGQRYTTVAMLGLRMEQGDDDGSLIALPDEPLNDQQERRVAEAITLWDQGPEQFEAWWARLQPQDKSWFIQTGRYAEITGKQAMPGTRLPAPTEERKPAQGKPPAAKSDTPEGWTAKYEADCAAASTLDELAAVQKRGASSMIKLKDTGLVALHARAIKAGSEAYSRLTEDGNQDDNSNGESQ